jgi:cytochrome P450
MVMKALKQRLHEKLNTTERQEHMCLMDLLIRDIEMEKQGLTEDYVLNLLFALIFASYETTSTTLTVAVKLLMENPDVLQELEVSAIRFRNIFACSGQNAPA